MRLLDYLLENGLAPDERTARGLIMRGDVLINERPETSPARSLKPEDSVRVRGEVTRPVSRGSEKLEPVLLELGFNPAGRICLDLGVSTGGFTQVLLKYGAQRVYAVDVAYGVTADEVRNDQRVVLLERTNARELTAEQVPQPVECVVGDLSFISWSAVVPAITPLLAEGAELLLLVKPQFELAARDLSEHLVAGVVSEPAAIIESLAGLYNTWQVAQLSPVGVRPAGLSGAKGNREYLVLLRQGGEPIGEAEYLKMIKRAIEEDRR